MKINNPSYITYYIDNNFEFILKQIYKCYTRMLIDYEFIENNENKIKNRLYRDYLNNQAIINEFELNQFRFVTETATIDENYNDKGYSDIEVIDLLGSVKDIKAFYVIECKRLDARNPTSKNSLFNKYQTEGIDRFVIEKYPTHNKVNGMLGFVVNSIDISKSMDFFTYFKPYYFIDNFRFSYKSNHTTNSNKSIVLYHLILDFSKKINPIP